MPEEYKNTKKAKPRGVSNRNRGLEYIRANATSGVFYFADDDNTYDISIFEQVRGERIHLKILIFSGLEKYLLLEFSLINCKIVAYYIFSTMSLYFFLNYYIFFILVSTPALYGCLGNSIQLY